MLFAFFYMKNLSTKSIWALNKTIKLIDLTVHQLIGQVIFHVVGKLVGQVVGRLVVLGICMHNSG